MAVPLEYNSCLFEKSLDQAIADYQSYQKSLEELDKSRREWDEENEKQKEEKERNGESFFVEDRTWP